MNAINFEFSKRSFKKTQKIIVINYKIKQFHLTFCTLLALIRISQKQVPHQKNTFTECFLYIPICSRKKYTRIISTKRCILSVAKNTLGVYIDDNKNDFQKIPLISVYTPQKMNHPIKKQVKMLVSGTSYVLKDIKSYCIVKDFLFFEFLFLNMDGFVNASKSYILLLRNVSMTVGFLRFF